MLKFLTQSVHINLSSSAITLTRSTGLVRPRLSVDAEVRIPKDTVQNPERLNELLSNVLTQAGCTNLPARITLSDELVRLFMVTPPQNSARPGDIYAAAEMRFRALYDQSSADWSISADWNAKFPFLACAVSDFMLTAIKQACSKHRLEIIAITPRFVSILNRCSKDLKPKAWFGVLDQNKLTFAAMNGKRICAVRHTSLPDEAREHTQWIPEYLKKEALCLHLPIPSQIQLCGNLPVHWGSQSHGKLACIDLAPTMPPDKKVAFLAGKVFPSLLGK